MHLLVLSAFRLYTQRTRSTQLRLNAPFGAQCFPTHESVGGPLSARGSQCTFWCSVLSDIIVEAGVPSLHRVSMHLLVLSAFRLTI